MATRIVPNKRGMKELEHDLGYGLLAVALHGELEAKREAPVHGGYRSFEPGVPPIGGTLRRSVHAVAYGPDSAQIGISNESGKSLPFADYVPIPGHFVAYMGTNTGYGAFVELGTGKMQARAFVAPGLDVSMQRAAVTIRDAVGRVRRAGVK